LTLTSNKLTAPSGLSPKSGGKVGGEVVKRAKKVEPTATSIHAVVKARKLGVRVHVLEVTVHVELHQPSNSKRSQAGRGGDYRRPRGMLT
jgi:hypothetical protein